MNNIAKFMLVSCVTITPAFSNCPPANTVADELKKAIAYEHLGEQLFAALKNDNIDREIGVLGQLENGLILKEAQSSLGGKFCKYFFKGSEKTGQEVVIMSTK